ncbi:MAG: GNAT family N-acetyltransferase [Ruminococcaceae bacterium]|nr:GNAT family N-acetyltransferase [Oscillospiraceae bacterium]
MENTNHSVRLILYSAMYGEVKYLLVNTALSSKGKRLISRSENEKREKGNCVFAQGTVNDGEEVTDCAVRTAESLLAITPDFKETLDFSVCRMLADGNTERVDYIIGDIGEQRADRLKLWTEGKGLEMLSFEAAREVLPPTCSAILRKADVHIKKYCTEFWNQLRLERTTREDLSVISEWFSHPSVYPWMPVEDFLPDGDFSQGISPDSGDENRFLLSVKLEGTLLAFIELEKNNNFMSLARIVVSPESQRMGVGRAVIDRVIKEGEMMFGDIVGFRATVSRENKAACRLLEDAGFDVLHFYEGDEVFYVYEL